MTPATGWLERVEGPCLVRHQARTLTASTTELSSDDWIELRSTG